MAALAEALILTVGTYGCTKDSGARDESLYAMTPDPFPSLAVGKGSGVRDYGYYGIETPLPHILN